MKQKEISKAAKKTIRTKASIIIGLLATIGVLVITIARQRRFDMSDLGSFVGAFFSGSNIPAALYLFAYGLTTDPLLAQTRLRGYEKNIAMAGLVLFLAS